MENGDQESTYEKTIKDPAPMDPEKAAVRLKEVKRLFDQEGVVFWLGSGTCLGAIRENRFIPWDDEMDTASVLGMHGLTEHAVHQMAQVFTDHGYFARVRPNKRWISCALVKDGLRTDWTVHRLINGRAIEFPGVDLPVYTFEHLKEIEFVGETFRVPNPPEDYLQAKYGPEWRTPKGPGFEADVLANIRDGVSVTGLAKIRRLFTEWLTPWRMGTIRVFDRGGQPVPGAKVRVAGVGTSVTNAEGYARIRVHDKAYFAVFVSFGEHKEVLYEEVLEPGLNYAYRPGPIVTKEEHYKMGVRAMALTMDQ